MHTERDIEDAVSRIGDKADRELIQLHFESEKERRRAAPTYDNESLIRDLIKLNITAVEALASSLAAIHMPPRFYGEEIQDD